MLSDGGLLSLAGGTIGATSAISTNTATVALTASTSGTASLSDSNSSLTINKSTAKVISVSDSAATSTITVAGLLTASNINIDTTGTNGSIAVNSNFGSTTSVIALTTTGSGTVTQQANTLITGSALTLNGAANMGTSSAKVLTKVASLTINNSGTGTDVYLSNSNVLNVLGATAGNSLQLANTAAITTSGAVNAPTVSLTGAGFIIKSAVGATSGTTTLTATGTGTMAWTSGGVDGTNVTLQSGTGTIGLTTNLFRTNTSNLTITNTGSAFISNNAVTAGPLTLDTSSTGNTLSVTNNGSIATAGTVNAGIGSVAGQISLTTTGGTGRIILRGNLGNSKATVTLSAGTVGSISQSTGNTITAAVLNIKSALGGVGGLSPLQTAAGTISVNIGTNADVNINNSGAVKVLASTAGTFDLTASGTLTVGGAINSASVDLATATGSAANIVLSANVGAAGGSTSISADGTGAVTETAGAIIGGNVVLASGGGSLGTSGQMLNCQASGQLSANTTGTTGNVYLKNSQAVELLSSSSGGAFYINANGNLKVDGITTNSAVSSNFGSITAIAGQGKLTVAGDLMASGGNITLQAANATSGSIEVAQGVSIHAASSLSTSGAVTAFVGTTLGTPVPGPQPQNITVHTSGGTVFFGKNGITGNSPNSDIYATQHNVTFSTGTQGTPAITLDGSDTITAAPISYESNSEIKDGDATVDTGDYAEEGEENTLVLER